MPVAAFLTSASSEAGSKENFASFHVPIWVWVAFLAFVSVLLVADLLLVHRTAHVSLVEHPDLLHHAP